MKYTVVSSAEFTYPDIFEYQSSSNRADFFACRGSYAAAQILFGGLECGALDVKISSLPDGVEAEVYTLKAIPVEQNINIPEEKKTAHFPEREAPFWVYDCFKTYSGEIELTDGVGGVYVALKISKCAEPGEYDISVVCGDTEIPASLKIYPAVLPEPTLKMVNQYARSLAAKYHNIPMGTTEFEELDSRHLALMKRMHQTMSYVSAPACRDLGDNKYEFDFTNLKKEIDKLESYGVMYYTGASIGWRKSWNESTIMVHGHPAMSYEAYLYLEQYIGAMRKFITENGLLDRFYLGVADEPNDKNYIEYRAMCGMIKSIAPELKLYDATGMSQLYGALDIYIPLNATYENNRVEFDFLKSRGAEMWFYVCCGPRGLGETGQPHINRFMDYPLLATKYLHWGNYKYDLMGYLHWAFNFYQPGQDPFVQSCPEHHNTDSVCYLPAGDTNIVYPGSDGPWISARLEAQRESAEEYELLKLVASRDKALADDICESVFRSFCDVEYDVNKYIAAKKRLLEAAAM